MPGAIDYRRDAIIARRCGAVHASQAALMLSAFFCKIAISLALMLF
jgi:hypothetical protein